MWRTGHRHGRVVRRVKKCALLFARVGAGERLPSERLVQTAHHGGDLLEGCTDPLIVIRLEEVALVAALRVEPIGEHLRIGAEGGPHRVLGLPAADDLRVNDHQIEVLPRARARARVSRGQGHITKGRWRSLLIPLLLTMVTHAMAQLLPYGSACWLVASLLKRYILGCGAP